MIKSPLANEIAFLVAHQNVDETTILARAMRKGVKVLYHDALTEAYLLGKISRDTILDELGPKVLEDIDLQRDALKRDVEWGSGDGHSH